MNCLKELTIELCCSNIHSVQLAEQYHFDAIEVCIDLHHGGLSPGLPFIKKAREAFSNEMAVFFRPRNGDFVYDVTEKAFIIEEIKAALDCNIDTVVAGGLLEDHSLDVEFMKRIIDASMGVTICFHRAIDVCADPDKLIQELIDLHIDRVLSSGGAKNAIDGIENLKKWNSNYGHQIEFMAGGGLDHKNSIKLINETGLRRFHLSLRKTEETISKVLNLGNKEIADEEKIEKLMSAFSRFTQN